MVEPGTIDETTGEPVEIVMNPTIAIKFLRDGIDSANAVANRNNVGQVGYDFFENSLHSILIDEMAPEVILDDPVNLHIKPTTNFVVSVGHADFSQYREDGSKVENPVFPYSLRYEPNEQLSFPADTYEVSIFEQMKNVPEGLLYKVFAMDKPVELGGEE